MLSGYGSVSPKQILGNNLKIEETARHLVNKKKILKNTKENILIQFLKYCVESFRFELSPLRRAFLGSRQVERKRF